MDINLEKNQKPDSIFHILYSSKNLGLTKREAEIVSMLFCRWSISRVANYFCREETTIYKHIENIKKKTACTTLFDLGVKIASSVNDAQ
jgi:DNA-binding NarL/FixJ family response regulator